MTTDVPPVFEKTRDSVCPRTPTVDPRTVPRDVRKRSRFSSVLTPWVTTYIQRESLTVNPLTFVFETKYLKSFSMDWFSLSLVP